MFKNTLFSLIIFCVFSAKATENLKLFNLPKEMGESVTKIIKAHDAQQKIFLQLLQVQILKGKAVFAVEFPFYHINKKLKNNNWYSLPKNQIYFLALKEAKKQVSTVLFNLLLGKDKASGLQKQLQQINNKQSKYYIFSEKVFSLQYNSSFSFISTAKVRLKISVLSLKKILDKESLLYSIQSKFNILPMINLLNTKTGHVNNWWQKKGPSLFSLASTLQDQKLNKTKKVYFEKENKQEPKLNQIFFDLKTQFLDYFSKKAKKHSLYVFRPKKHHFKHFLPEYLLQNAAFSANQIAFYLNPDLLLNADVNYQIDEKKQVLKVLFLFKIFKRSNKKIVISLSQKKQWSLNSNKTEVSKKIQKQIFNNFKDLGDQLLSNLLNLKNKALLQSYQSSLAIKGVLSPTDLYRFMSVLKFHIREILTINLQSLGQFKFYLKLNSTLKIKDIANKINHLQLSNYIITDLSLASDQNKIKFYLKKNKK